MSRALRYLYRVPALMMLLFLGLPVALAAIGLGPRPRDWAIRWWSGLLLRVVGIRVICHGAVPAPPVMLLANHVSWVDIEVIHSLIAASFVAKAEIAHWPVVGAMATAGGTVYHRRGSDASREGVSEALRRKLSEGRAVCLFPEGRTGPGHGVLPFHGRLLQPALDEGAPIVPVALDYRRDGMHINAQIAFAENESFVAGFVRLLGAPPCLAHVSFLPEVRDQGQGRRGIASLARQHIVQSIEQLG